MATRGALALGLLAATWPSAAQQSAQEEEAEESYIEEVVVTVERREQNLQDLGVTAYSFQGDDLKMQGVQDITDLSELAPGLEIGNKGGNVEVWIRGVGSSNNTELGDPAAATHLDGVYLPRTSGIGSAFAGYGLAGFAPGAFGASWSLNAAGCIAVVSGVAVAAAALFGQRRHNPPAGAAALHRM